MKHKAAYGQFYSTRVEYLLHGHQLSAHVNNIIEPFVGQGDLLTWSKLKKLQNASIEAYDLYPKIPYSRKQNTLKTPPVYTGKFVLTNPPYLAMNHSRSKTIFRMYDEDDLYKCFLRSILNPKNTPNGGLIIIPLNFWCSVRDKDAKLREDFLKTFRVTRCNVYEEQVFDDTTYTVCSFSFVKHTNESVNKNEFLIPTFIYRKGKVQKEMSLQLSKKQDWRIGGELYHLAQHPKYTITRSAKPNTNMHVYAIDSGTSRGRIHMMYDPSIIFKDQTSRSHATIHIDPPISVDHQKRIAHVFNLLLEKYRKKYHSLFLTNYRESKDYARKRIPFDLVYILIGHLLLREKHII